MSTSIFGKGVTTSTGLKSEGIDDSAILARLGYKQELKREFSILELFGFGFSIAAVVPSVS
jgi:hypothetical protein